MEIETCTCSRSVKANLGGYESHDVFVSVTARLGELDTFEEVYSELQSRVEQAVLVQLVRLHTVKAGRPQSVEAIAQRYGLRKP